MTLLRNALLLGLSAVTLSAAFAADIKAITEDGRRVILGGDGRWSFDNAQPPGASRQPLSESPFRPTVKGYSVNFDTTKWTLSAPDKNEAANRRTFRHRTLPLYAMVVSDEIPATSEIVRNVIVANAKSAGGDPKVLADDTKSLRGKDVGMMRMLVSLNGLDFVFSTAYYGDQRGNIQVMCWTGQSLFFKYQADCQAFVEGLAIE